MGGLEIDVNSNVVGPNGPIKGLYAAGEVAGGVHGNNRLGGNSLLDCVVFGRLSGTNAAKYMLGAPSMDIPQRYQSKATHIGYVLTAFIAIIYFSFPIYTHLCSMKTGALGVTG